jgi:hypothetical protein
MYPSNNSIEYNETNVTMGATMELDAGVIFFGFSFAVISLLILLQVGIIERVTKY